MTETIEPEKVTSETVPPWNGKTEDKLVFMSLAVMLLLAAGLLQWLYPSQEKHTVKIPNEIRQQLTALSNAAEEILMIKTLESQQPTLKHLQDWGIAPFHQVQLAGMAQLDWHQTDDCMIGNGQLKATETSPASAFQLLLAFNRHHTGQTVAEHRHDSHQQTEQIPPYLIGWRHIDPAHSSHQQNTPLINCPAVIDRQQWFVFTAMPQ